MLWSFKISYRNEISLENFHVPWPGSNQQPLVQMFPFLPRTRKCMTHTHLLLNCTRCFDAFSTLLPRAAPAVVAFLEHVRFSRIQHPVAAFSTALRSTLLSRNFDKAVVQTQIVSYRILPTLFIISVIREFVHDKLVNAIKRYPLIRRRRDRHGYEGNV